MIRYPGSFLQFKPLASGNISRLIHGLTTQIEGHKIHYEKVGSGERNVLLLPGALGMCNLASRVNVFMKISGSTRTDFAGQLSSDGLNQEKFTLLAWDPPGYGYSRPPVRNLKDNYYRNDARMVSKLATQVFGSKNLYSVLGWSDGGITALILAANEGLEDVEKVVIWGSNAYVTEGDRSATSQVRDTDNWNPRFRTEFEKIYGTVGLKKLWADYVDRYQLWDDICSEDLKRIKCPLLILHGDKDPMVAPEHPEFIAKNVANCRLHRFPGGKHNIHIKYQEEFNHIVEKFLLE